MADIVQHRVAANGIEINVAILGEGPPTLLLNGRPHTLEVVREMVDIAKPGAW